MPAVHLGASRAAWCRGSGSAWRRSGGLPTSPAAAPGDLPDRSVAACGPAASRCSTRLTAAGVRYFDAARSYGRAEEFLAGWLTERGHPDAVAGSKWGYRYTADWRLDAEVNEVKEHSLAMFTSSSRRHGRYLAIGWRCIRCTR